jgi:phage repressor protein C with HTH and peptisase S24 domain
MNEPLEESELPDPRQEVRIKIDHLHRTYGMDINDIAEEITKVVNVSVWAVYKWRTGESSPINSDAIPALEILNRLLEKKELEKQNKTEELEKSIVKEEPSYEIGSSKLISVFFDSDVKTTIYKGDLTKLGRVTEIEGKKAFIIYEIVSTKEGVTNWVIFIHDESMAPTIKRGSVIAIDKININISDFKPGYTYCIIDSTYQVHVRKVFIENETTVKLVSLNEIDFPHFKLELTQIRAIFRVVDALNINP